MSAPDPHQTRPHQTSPHHPRPHHQPAVLPDSRSRFEHASTLITRDVPITEPDQTVAQCQQLLHSKRFDCASHLIVCDGDRFVGVVRIEDLLIAEPALPIRQIMNTNAASVGPGVDQEMAAWRAVRRDESALSVIDADGRFIGLISAHRLLAVVLEEHDEDIARLGGFLKNSTTARLASEEPLMRRFLHRMPWLLLGLAGALMAADLIGYFEDRLQQTLLLAFFIPGIVYIADAVGTQTETVIVRGLSVGVEIRRVVKLELLSGVGIGIALALVALPLIWWHWQSLPVAITVASAIFTSCSVATLVALSLPWLLDRLHIDPAFGSGPLATVIQDILSLLIYFVLAVAILA